MLVAALVIIVALSLVAYAYWRSLPSQMGPRVTLTSSPFELSFALDKSAYSHNDNMTIGFYLRNISNETITATISDDIVIGPGDTMFKLGTVGEGVDTSHNQSNPIYTTGEDPMLGRFPFGFSLFTGNGTFINKAPALQTNSFWSIYFEPNASLNQTLSLNLPLLILDMSGSSQPLENGAYQIIGSFEASWNGKGSSTFETPSIVFTIR
jgi:hypothetical protein